MRAEAGAPGVTSLNRPAEAEERVPPILWSWVVSRSQAREIPHRPARSTHGRAAAWSARLSAPAVPPPVEVLLQRLPPESGPGLCVL